jgi:ribonuclease R
MIERPDKFKQNSAFSVDYGMEQMLQFGEHCSMTERRADEATRDVTSWLKCEYMSGQIGEEFEGVVSAVTNFGVFVELNDLYVDGLVHITSLPSDYYHFEADKQRLVGERTRRVFKLGDPLKVRVAAVTLDERKIDFELLESEQKAQKKPSVRERMAMGLFDQKKSGKSGKPGGSGGRGGRGPAGKSGGRSSGKAGGRSSSKNGKGRGKR